ncbi:MAG: hypothetical protein IJV06_02815 [Bacteroidaceae bacterium]|nr:hypothetical protein [Bacteroidaceae bacterium]
MMENQEILSLLEAQGWHPQLCDTAVPYIDSRVVAGNPTMPGDWTRGQYVMLPKEVVGLHPTFVIEVTGDSMVEAGIHEGDRLTVQLGVEVTDGNVVLACLDGETTVKVLFTDEEGVRWLVPRNKAYRAIRLDEYSRVDILGKVVGQSSPVANTPYRESLAAVRRTLDEARRTEPVDERRVADAVLSVAQRIGKRRLWFAVYRAVADRGGVRDCGEFVRLLQRVVPAHAFLPDVKELRRMDVLSFSHPLSLWDKENAPVSGVRFDEYLRIAQEVAQLLK